MTTWSNDDLERLGDANEIQIAPENGNGETHRPITIWIVRHDDDLFVRSARGPEGRWYRTAGTTHRGRIHAAGLTRDVTFADETDPAVNDQIDAAYLAKYGSTPWAEPMTRPGPRDTTLRLTPAE
ncbi:DUF2255 family protein [Actinomadura barringtoniae]|uniref:DUF2255 family protein n=1 Tax=Actinomadura barringtoniae TaxID=1427535 RepID=A0A939PEB3_9ACTN|nr:DUF2255 family protein [Actinomadura barringtoniae]MBO2451272.1 DUF2255 family protein [Actinomadura barringtoniae]